MVHEWERLDVLCSLGPRRPDWTRAGAPSPRELDAMMAYRKGILAGYPSMGRLQVTPQGHQSPPRSTSLRSASGMDAKVRRPYGMPDDHPDVIAGVYS